MSGRAFDSGKEEDCAVKRQCGLWVTNCDAARHLTREQSYRVIPGLSPLLRIPVSAKKSRRGSSESRIVSPPWLPCVPAASTASLLVATGMLKAFCLSASANAPAFCPHREARRSPRRSARPTPPRSRCALVVRASQVSLLQCVVQRGARHAIRVVAVVAAPATCTDQTPQPPHMAPSDLKAPNNGCCRLLYATTKLHCDLVRIYRFLVQSWRTSPWKPQEQADRVQPEIPPQAHTTVCRPSANQHAVQGTPCIQSCNT